MAYAVGGGGFGGAAANVGTSGITQPRPTAQQLMSWPEGKMPYVKIVEQPAENKLRFRYECEGRSAGSLHGCNHTQNSKTFPTIQIVGYTGPAVVVVSCVEDKPPHRTHPHNLVGKDGSCKKGVCSVDFNSPDMTVQFQHLGIQCVKKRDAPASLSRREQIQVDPLKQGFRHKHSAINLNCLRLCFQVFLKIGDRGLVPLEPVVSNVIRDKKSHSDLQIIDYSDDVSPVDGGKKILLFCEKVYKDDIEVHFAFHAKSGEAIVRRGEFAAQDVHKQHGISLKTPPYPNQTITSPVLVSMYLYKPSERSTSEPVDFWYTPRTDSGQGREQELANLNSSRRASNPKSNKREREKQAGCTNEDPSSGMVNIPPKMTTPSRDGGGEVGMVQDHGNSVGDMYDPPPFCGTVTPQPYPSFANGIAAGSTHSNYGQRNSDHHLMENIANMMAISPSETLNHQIMPTQEIAKLDEKPPTAGQQNADPQGARPTGDFSGQFMLSSLSLTNLDVNTADLDNLSSNLSMHLTMEKGSENVPFGAKDFNRSKAKHPKGEGYERQSSMLDTPDISLMSLDSESNRKNNLDK